MDKPQTTNRGQLSFPPDRGWRDDGASFSWNGEHLTIAVSEEQAVDSYNSQFECSYYLDREKAKQLHVWLGEILV